LQNDPVYRNKREHFRFLVPDGWIQSARQDLPSGRLEKERLLVQYRRLSDQPAILEVSCTDLPESSDLAAYMAGPAFGSTQWHRLSPAEQFEVDGIAALRVTLAARVGAEDRAREVVVFRRGERVYFFTGLYAASDSSARDEIRRAVAAIIFSD
jgi:hypothetical protein